MPGPAKPRTTTAIRFPPELHEKLTQAAADRDLSINYIVVKAVEQFVERLLPVDEIKWTKDSA